MTDKILIDRATLEQLVGALETGRWNTRALAGWDPSEIGKDYNDDNDKINAALTAGRAALAGAERVEPDTQLCKFYDVATYPDLVAAMEKHITKLQARTPPLTGEAFTQKPRFA